MNSKLELRLENRLERQAKLIALLKEQLADLVLMTKIELGDDVIEEINRLEGNTPLTLRYTGGLSQWSFSTVRSGEEISGLVEISIDAKGEESAPDVIFYPDKPDPPVVETLVEEITNMLSARKFMQTPTNNQ